MDADFAHAVIKAARFPMLATVDPEGQPRLRPVSPVRTEGFTVYVASLRSYGKTADIAGNPRVELCYLSPQHDQVRITGMAEVLEDRALLEELWAGNPLLRKYLGTPENPELIIYKICPVRVRYMKEWSLEYTEIPLPAGGSLQPPGAVNEAHSLAG